MDSSNFQFRLATGNGGNDGSDGNVVTTTSGNTVTVGNVAYRVVSAASTTTTSQNAGTNNSGSNGLQATAVLASPLNGQFYVIGNPSEVLGGSRTIAPRFTLDSTSPPGTGSGGGTNPRHDRRRATHNEVERRRRDNINAWIMKLGRLIPPEHENGPPKSSLMSKGGILARACDYITELRDTNRELLAKFGGGVSGGLTVRESDNLRLQRQVEALKQENSLLREQVESLNKQLDSHEGIDPLLN